MVEAPDLDSALDACRHEHRRIILATLAEQQQPLSTDDLTNTIIELDHHISPTEVDDETVERIRIGLLHVHLPKLAEAGFIQYDHERNVVELPA